MLVKYGHGKTPYGPGVIIELDGDEIATAIEAYLVAHQVTINGPRTIQVNGELCERGHVYVDPSGFVVSDGEMLSGRGADRQKQQEEIDKLKKTFERAKRDLAKQLSERELTPCSACGSVGFHRMDCPLFSYHCSICGARVSRQSESTHTHPALPIHP